MSSPKQPLCLVFCLFIIFTCQNATYADERDRLKGLVAPVVGSAQRELLISQTLSALDYRGNDSRSGLFPSTVISPNIGRLLVQRTDDSQTASCSGVAINNKYFLTAAHCICNVAGRNATGYADCLPFLKNTKLNVFFPALGSVPIVNINIHPKYYSPSKIKEKDYREVADIAVLEFADTVELNKMAFSEGSGSFLAAGSGIMYFTIASYAEALSFPAGEPLQDGVFHNRRLTNVSSDKATCGPYHSVDTMCNFYVNIPVESGPLQSTTVCSGDSGGPVFQRNKEGKIVIAAITSYFSPSDRFDRCIADSSKRNHYVMVGHYVDWISTFSAASDSVYAEKLCVSAIFKGKSFELIGFRGLITITTFSSAQNKRPAAELSTAEKCSVVENFGVYTCPLRGLGYSGFKINEAFAQVTLCDR